MSWKTERQQGVLCLLRFYSIAERHTGHLVWWASLSPLDIWWRTQNKTEEPSFTRIPWETVTLRFQWKTPRTGQIDFSQTILVTKAINCMAREWWRLSLSEALGCGLWGARVVEGSRDERLQILIQSCWKGAVLGTLQSVTASATKSPESQPMSVKSILSGSFIKMRCHFYPLPSPKSPWIWTCPETLSQQLAPLISPSFKNSYQIQVIQILTWLKMQV